MFDSKYTGEQVEELLDGVEGKQDKLEYYSETHYDEDDDESYDSAQIDIPEGGGIQVTEQIEEGMIGSSQVNVTADLIYLRANRGTVRVSANNVEWNEEQVATVKDVPTKTSELENDSGYITSSDVPTKTSELENDSGYITSSDVPTKTSELENDSGYITSSDVPTKTSELENDSGYITSSDVPTKTSELENDSGYITSSDVPTKTSELENDSGYITEETIEGKQDKLKYYSEGKDSIWMTTGVPVFMMEGNSIALGTDRTDESCRVGVETNSGDVDINCSTGGNLIVTANDFEWNGSQVATVGDVPTKVSELENDSDYTTVSYVDSVKSDVEAEIPTKVSALTNDAGYITEEAIEGKQDKLTAGEGITIENNVISATFDVSQIMHIANLVLYRDKYPLTTLLKKIDDWFCGYGSGSSLAVLPVDVTNMYILDFDEESKRATIRIEVLLDSYSGSGGSGYYTKLNIYWYPNRDYHYGVLYYTTDVGAKTEDGRYSNYFDIIVSFEDGEFLSLSGGYAISQTY